MLSPNPIGFVSPLVVALLAFPASAQHRATPEPGALRLEVTPQGAFYRTVAVSADDRGGPRPLTPAGLIWSHPDGGLAWIGNSVSLGNNGSEVFTEYDLNNEATELFSVNDTNPPTAIWSDATSVGSENHQVASAEATNTKVAIHTINFGTPQASVVLRKYTSLSPVPDWTYGWDFAGTAHVGISRDGQTIVAAVGNGVNGTADVVVFTPASNVPVSYTPIAIGANNDIRGFDLSADGSTLYVSSSGSPTAYIFDVATASVVFSQNIGASFDSHAISGDGKVFAFGNFGSMSVYEKTGTFYTNTHTQIVGGPCYCAMIDISDDGSTIASGYTFYGTGYQTVQIFALDVPTKGTTMTDTVSISNPNVQNIVSALSISANGQRFAVGLWGDGAGPVAEARFYARNQNAAIGTVNLPGSVFGIQISADGNKMVSGSKAVHANQFGNGGSIDLWGEGTPFTSFCAAGIGGIVTCPCGNPQVPAGSTTGCDNFVAPAGGATLAGTGNAVTNVNDTVQFQMTGGVGTSVTVLFQGTTNTANTRSGAGVRCVGGTLKRLYKGNPVAGAISFPNNGVQVHDQSAAKGFVINAPVTLFYYCAYRNSAANGQPGCPGLNFGFNSSNAVSVPWSP